MHEKRKQVIIKNEFQYKLILSTLLITLITLNVIGLAGLDLHLLAAGNTHELAADDPLLAGAADLNTDQVLAPNVGADLRQAGGLGAAHVEARLVVLRLRSQITGTENFQA